MDEEIEPPSPDVDVRTARAARNVMIAVALAALGPTLLATAVASMLVYPLGPATELAAFLLGVVSTRGQNVTARWMLLGPGAAKTRLILGAFLLGADWLAVTLLLKLIYQGAPAAAFGIMVALKFLCGAFSLAWWGIVRTTGERDCIPGIEFPGRTFGIRDLLVGLLLFAFVLAGARLALDVGSAPADGMAAMAFLIGSGAILVWSGGTLCVDMGLRLFVLGDVDRRRGLGLAAFFALFFLALLVLAFAGNAGEIVFEGFLFLAIPYLIPAVIFETALSRLGVRAVNVGSVIEISEEAGS